MRRVNRDKQIAHCDYFYATMVEVVDILINLNMSINSIICGFRLKFILDKNIVVVYCFI